MNESEITTLDDLDRKIIVATQSGLPLVSEPYAVIAKEVESSTDEVIKRVKRMLESGIIRRIGAVPNHYTLGFKGNGMTVWDIPDNKVRQCGEMIGALDFVSHAYERPRHQPEWNYNLFAMVHGKDRTEVEKKVKLIADMLGDNNRGHEILYSSRILKKTGLRLASAK
ncbi:MAG: AsnC family transcriptional regulator [Sedimenticola sp.]|uniref:siroheme decarboxylase n=1 Tax=Sedimenticola thiotaurini TaxID=1543721 RepID=A0A558CMC2_9GAMM|nr:AsnC family transcriptional regulator [Sedimenticola sp.]MCW8947779.1 AsnC family transcriptional regulator [Sedimenticola sp.]MCW8951062.1 AsnC family transcriptional regulator [Sedimenticola sp.]MCW8976563.1 AsnC family transcriptional regulator [Sedimenticola sp.]TVT49916.1 MAG: Lrp/AsnC family transcriptional regulator [Sedimenticola thiotaurini]